MIVGEPLVLVVGLCDGFPKKCKLPSPTFKGGDNAGG